MRESLMKTKGTDRCCGEIRSDGRPCQGRRLGNSTYCAFHDPQFEGARAEGRRAGGIRRSRRAAVLPAERPDLPLGTTPDLVRLLEMVANCLLRGQLTSRDVTSLAYLASVQANLIHQESVQRLLSDLKACMTAGSTSGSVYEADLTDIPSIFEAQSPNQSYIQTANDEPASEVEPSGAGDGSGDEDEGGADEL